MVNYFLIYCGVQFGMTEKANINKAEVQNVISKTNGYRFSAFWLRSKCSICSYQLNI